MKQGHYYKLLDLLEDIKGVDKMIHLHSGDDSAFMIDQYNAKKNKLVGTLIDELISPQLRSARSLHTIKMVIDRFYADEMSEMDKSAVNDDLSKLEHALI